LHFGREVFVFEIRRQNQFDEGIAEKERILTVIEPEAHFVKVRSEDVSPRLHVTFNVTPGGRIEGS